MTNPSVDVTTIHLPDAPVIDGIRIRSFDIGRDVGALAELIASSNALDGVEYAPSADDLRNELEHHANFDTGRDILVAEVAGRLVGGTMQSSRLRGGTVQHELECWVRPDMRRRGLGRTLLHWAERRSRDAAEEAGGPDPHGFSGWVGDTQAGAIALLESEGYHRVRYGFMMVRALSEPIPDAPLPDGFEIRPVVEADHRRIWDADKEAFLDHWEAAVRTEEDYVGTFSMPGIDTSLWRVAWAGDEVAGSVMSSVFSEENERLCVRRGWLEHISVRRPWRRRGLAGSLIVQSLRALRDHGLDEAALGVDAENLTGALRLYEAFGFRRLHTDIAYRKAF